MFHTIVCVLLVLISITFLPFEDDDQPSNDHNNIDDIIKHDDLDGLDN